MLLSSPVIAQESLSVRGIVVEKAHQKPLNGAHIRLSAVQAGNQYTMATDSSGRFRITGIRPGSYTVRCSYLGYTTAVLTAAIQSGDLDLGVIALADTILPLGEALIVSRIPGAEIHGDSIFYTANAFKTDSDATAEELVTKLPGVSVDDQGAVHAQGEDVQQILVDGRSFFGSDPLLTLRNLPSESIDRIEIFEKLSDQAQFTGFDDGQSVKTMNIVTRRERSHSTFGRTSSSYGTDDRYQASGAINFFADRRRISLIGLSNNINQQNFTQQDLLGISGSAGNRLANAGRNSGGMFGTTRSGRTTTSISGPVAFGESGANFLVGHQTGITSAHSLGLNYIDSIWNNFYTEGSYFFNRSDNRDPATLLRRYALSADSGIRYDQTTNSSENNYNHRFNLRTVYTIDSTNVIIVTPRLYLQNNHATGSLNGQNTALDGSPTAFSSNSTRTNTDGYSFRNHIAYLHRFGTPGRSFTLDAGMGKNHRSSERTIVSNLSFPSGSLGRPDSINHKSDISSDGHQFSASLVYTEPVGIRSLIQVNYNPAFTQSDADDRAYDFDPLTESYTLLNTRYSNTHQTRYTTHRGGIGWKYHIPSLTISTGLAYQSANLRSDQTFPRVVNVDKTFYTILPSALLDLDLSVRQNLRIEYSTATTAPTVTQLRDLVNKSNFLLVRTGNSDLKQSFTQAVSLRLSISSLEAAESFFLLFSANHTQDYIGDALLYASHDTILARGIHLGRGAQILSPVNLNNFWSFRAEATYGMPVGFLESNLTFGAGYSFTSIPGLISGTFNRANLSTFSPEITLSSTASDNLDFSVSYGLHFNRDRNQVFTQLNNSYVRHGFTVRIRSKFLNGFVARTDLSNTTYSGFADSLDRNRIIWNISFGHKFLHNKRGEILFGVRNVLDQQTLFSRSADEAYLEDANTILLGRYYLLTLSYTLR